MTLCGACASRDADQLPEDATRVHPIHPKDSHTASFSSAAGQSGPSVANSWSSIAPWTLVANEFQPAGGATSFTRITVGARKGLQRTTPSATLLASRQMQPDGTVLVTRAPSDQARPLTATLQRLPDGSVSLAESNLSEGFTIRSIAGTPIVWLPADLEALRNQSGPLIIRSRAAITRDGSVTENPYTLRIRAIGNRTLPVPADLAERAIGIEWDLTLDAGPTIRVRIESWYVPGEGIVADSRAIDVTLGPIPLFTTRERWLRTDLFELQQAPK